MFDIPIAKRLKRSELLVEDSDNDNAYATSEDHNEDALPQDNRSEIDYGFEYDFVERPPPGHAPAKTDPENDAETESFQFHLFKPRSRLNTDLHTEIDQSQNTESQLRNRVTIRSPTPLEGSEGGFVRGSRPDSYYLTAALPPDKIAQLKDQYAEMALSGIDILDQCALTKWPGTILPWRVIRLPSTRVQDRTGFAGSSPLANPQGSERLRQKRSHHSKKRRILIRKKILIRRAKKTETMRDEQAEREKRTKKNRERKAKRRALEKKKKQAANAATITPEKEPSGESDSS